VTRVLPFGSWPTPITSDLVVQASVSLGGVAVDGDDVWWSEQRPDESGRTVIVRNGVDVLPPPWNARTRVHEYGGGSWWVAEGTLWFTHWDDQRVYRFRPDDDSEPEAVTPEPAVGGGLRYTDGVVDRRDGAVVCVRERHAAAGGEAVNEIVRLPDEVLVSGPDFVSDPRVGADGRLCWIQWHHPDMPWDGTELCVDGTVVAGGREESLFQPTWGPDGSLYVVSDRTGWWNLYRLGDGGALEPVVEIDAEIGVPQWVFGQKRYAVLDDGRIVFAYQRDGFDHLAVRTPDGAVDEVDQPFTAVSSVVARGAGVVFVGASPTSDQAVVSLGLETSAIDELRPPRDLGVEPAWLSTPRSIDFPTAGGATAHALFYPPTNPECSGPPDARPPLVVVIHGGPTAAARPMLQLGIQYWTSRGFAVADVNYRGSTGYGRAYRDALKGRWGVADVDDCVACAAWLAEQGLVDGKRLAIRGGSAGGYTTLAALAFRDVFSAGASHYGVADLEALATETHKFESRYLDGLVGPYPAARDVYVERSPIHHAERIDRPLIVFQGLEDEVVPPNQAEMIVEAVRANGVPVEYVPFEGEQHGFRRAENIRTALDRELAFYGRVFRFD
jgi:dipeptidyl aminopeptidase/acylaminoacyl peptidase